MEILVGYTGFVGSNLYVAHHFDRVFNSKNIDDAYGLNPDLLVYAGMRAEKYLANNFPAKDMELIEDAKRNIRLIAPKRIVLISTVDVYKRPVEVNEDSAIELDDLHAYGKNRYLLEQWVGENYQNALIIRLPGLFGRNIKKNFIYDYINKIPFMLRAEKLNELATVAEDLPSYYFLRKDGYYQCKDLKAEEKKALRKLFERTGFSAINFTDSRNVYQFYPLERLWNDICIALEKGITLWNPATEPVSAAELYQYLSGDIFINEINQIPAYYDYRTKYAEIFGGKRGYILSKEQVMDSIKRFVKEMLEKG